MRSFMPVLEQIKVESHSGYRADEYPKRFLWNDKWFEVAEIDDRWYQGESNPEFPASDYFRVTVAGSGSFILKHDLAGDKWYMFYEFKL